MRDITGVHDTISAIIRTIKTQCFYIIDCTGKKVQTDNTRTNKLNVDRVHCDLLYRVLMTLWTPKATQELYVEFVKERYCNKRKE